MFSSFGMGGNIHSALLNSYPKQAFPFSGQFPSIPQVPMKSAFEERQPEMLFTEQNPFNGSMSKFIPETRPQSSYSSSGFDLLSVLSYLANRPNPTINIGPVDLSCAFLLVDVRKQDFPIVYSSPSFLSLTGYDMHEIIGRNCRFLQSPDGCVTLGSRRKFTDNSQVLTMKNEIHSFREHQSSIVNYKKGGQPFINLLTMIPIIENGLVNFYVGLQVDLVEQPGAILKNIQDGNYAVNYGMHTFTKEIKPDDPFSALSKLFLAKSPEESKFGGPSPLIEHIDLSQKLIEDSTEFIHVLSLRGTFLYSSPGVHKLLGYSPSELYGTSLSDICHPGDILPVMRDLKEASSTGSVCLIYRIKLKEGGFAWMESLGKIHNDIGKGRRCIVFSGRIRPVYQLSTNQLAACGGEVSLEEAWFKLSTCGMVLYVSPNCKDILGFSPHELSGTSLFQFLPPDQALTLTLSLEQTCSGKASRMIHGFQHKAGRFIDVVSVLILGSNPVAPGTKPEFILCRTKAAEFQEFHSPVSSPKADRNIFEVLSPNNSASWQYELQQLRIKNRKLRDEIEHLSPKVGKQKRSLGKSDKYCKACLRTSTPEWRRGPEGPASLCNSCGLKYAKGISPYSY